MSPQVGFGSEYGIDNIGCYWFYCNASNEFGQKCLLCTTDLSHVTDFMGGLRQLFLQEVERKAGGRGSRCSGGRYGGLLRKRRRAQPICPGVLLSNLTTAMTPSMRCGSSRYLQSRSARSPTPPPSPCPTSPPSLT